MLLHWQHTVATCGADLTIQEHLRSPQVFNGVCVAQFSMLCFVYCYSVSFLAMALSVFLTSEFEFPFVIFFLTSVKTVGVYIYTNSLNFNGITAAVRKKEMFSDLRMIFTTYS